MLIDLLDEDDWSVLRDARLRAVRQSPEVFGAALAREELFREQHWRARLRTSQWFVARDGAVPGDVVGLVNMIQEPASPPDDRHVMALWVEPGRRRTGVATALLVAASAAARSGGARTLSAWVVDDDVAGVDLAVRNAFVVTGERQRLPREPERVESRYVRALDRPA